MSATLNVNVNPSGAVRGAQAAEAALARLGVKATELEGTLLGVGRSSDRLGQAFGALTASFAVKAVLDASDAYTVVQNRLKQVTSSSEELATVYGKVLSIAQRTGSDLESTTKFYTQLTLNSKELGLTSEKTMRITETLAKVIGLSGQSAEASSNALIQLQQAMGSGALRGDELRSVMEQLPMVAQIIADKMGTTVGKLKDFGAQGAISAKLVSEALLASSNEVDKAFGKMTFTFSQSFRIVYNSFTDFIGSLNQATGVLSLLSKGIAWVGKELGNIVTVITALAAAWAGLKMVLWVNQMNQVAATTITFYRNMVIATGGMTGFQLAMQNVSQAALNAAKSMLAFTLSNPFTAMFAALAIVLPLLYAFRDSIKLSADGSVTLGTYIKQWQDYIVANMPKILDYVSSFLQSVIEIGKVFVGAIIPAFKAFFSAVSPILEIISGLIEAFTGVSNSIDLTKGSVVALVAVFNPWLGAATAVLMILNQLDPGLKATTFAVQALGEAIGILIRLALVPVVASFTTVINILNAFGVVSDELTQKVNDKARSFMDFNSVLDESTGRLQVAYDEMQSGVKTTDAASKSTGELTKQAGAISPAFNAAAEKANALQEKVGAAEARTTALKIASEAVRVPLDAAGKTMDSVKQHAHELAAAVNEAADALNRLQKAKQSAGISGGLDGSSASIDGARASGGPVKAGSRYLVGENGPELFVPGTNGNIIPNGGAAKEMARVRGNDVGTTMLAKAVKNVAVAIDGMAVTQSKQAKSVEQVYTVATKAVTANTKALTLTPYDKSSFDLQGYQEPTSYNGRMDTWMQPGVWNYGVTDSNGTPGYATAEQYAAWMKENAVLPGDAAYKSYGKQTTDNGTSFYSYDSNTPLAKEIASAQERARQLEAMLQRYAGFGSDPTYKNWQAEYDQLLKDTIPKLQAQSDTLVAQLKQAREAGAAYASFMQQLPAMMKDVPKIDFQTLWGYQGGSVVPRETDPYKLREQSQATSAKSEAPITVNMQIVAKDVQSYRQNSAEIEAGLLAMVKRAKKREGS